MGLQIPITFLEVDRKVYSCGCILREHKEWNNVQRCDFHTHLDKDPTEIDEIIEIGKHSPQKNFFNLNKRNQCFSGGFGNGKTFIGCMKLLVLLLTFPNSRALVVRNRATDLRKTTMVTFYQVCKPELYEEKKGGYRKDSYGELKLINGSQVYFMHFDEFQESALKSLEINFLLIDQAEEISEEIYLLLNSRVGRWSGAEVPKEMLTIDWPKNPITGAPRVPSYVFNLCNPDTKLHWLYKRHHPESIDFKLNYSKNHDAMIMASTRDNPTIDPELLDDMLSRDPQWVSKYVDGIWGMSEGTIHTVSQLSKLYVGPDFIENLVRRAKLYRIMDHGESAPTCCLWVAAYKGCHYVYREYYQPDQIISFHRCEIARLSEGEFYMGNYADPSIFDKNNKKKGGRFSVADEYLDMTITDEPPIAWQPADNNEYHTRNRINELLKLSKGEVHPITLKRNAPKLYFIMKDENNPNGCQHVVIQTESQKRVQIGSENGLPQFSDERDEKIVDHAYDPLRYYVALHAVGNTEPLTKAKPGSWTQVWKNAKSYQQEMKFEETYM